MNTRTELVLVFAFAAVLNMASTTHAAGPLKEAGVTALVEAGFDDAEIIAKIEKDGIAFEVDSETLIRLRTAGVPREVLRAVMAAHAAAAATAKAAPSGDPLIAFDKIVTLLENGVDSELIIAKLPTSAATYTLSAEQEQQLRAAGGTDDLIAAMKSGAKDATTAEPISDLALVLDVSASMNEATTDGRTKIEVAKEVVSELVRTIPAGLNVTVVVYGHAPGCSAVKVLRSLSELKAGDREPLAVELQQLPAVGNTPIALALRMAGEQFAGRKTYCGVVLITDGLESCNGDPSAEAARLAENPMLRFGVNVLGFGLKPEESEATAEIARQGKGRYYDAKDPAALLAAIKDMTKKLGEGAKPAPFNPASPVGKRAVVVVAPQIQMPPMKELATADQSGTNSTLASYKINTVTEYGAELRQPSADPVNIWWIPEKGLPVLMVGQFENPQREIKQLRPEDYLGMVRLQSDGGGTGVRIVVATLASTAGTVSAYVVQEADAYNQDMVVPVGTYKLWVIQGGGDPVLLEEELQVAGGQVTAIAN